MVHTQRQDRVAAFPGRVGACRKSIVAVCVAALCSLAGAQEPAPVKSAAEVDYPPFSYVDDAGNAAGFSVELLTAALATMGQDVVFDVGVWEDVRGWLERGEVEVLPLVARTAERDLLFDFSNPYLTMHAAIVVRDDDKTTATINDLSGKTVAVMRGDGVEEFLRRESQNFDIVTTDTYATALKELAAGRHDAVVMQRVSALRLIDQLQLSTLRVVDRPVEGYQEDFCFAVPEGERELLALLNEGLAVLMADGTFRYLHAKWFAALELPKDRPIIVGGDADFPPFEYLNDAGEPEGFNVELTKAIAREMGMDVEIRLAPWAEIVEALRLGEVDILQGMLYSPERDVDMNFAPAHAMNEFVAVVRDEDGPPPRVVDELRGKAIVVQEGNLAQEFALAHGLGDRLAVVPSQEDALRELVEGMHDCAIVSSVTAIDWIHFYGWDNLSVGSQALVSAEYCYAAPNGSEALLAQFAMGLKRLHVSGEYRKLYETWLGVFEEPKPGVGEILRIVAAVFIPLLLVLLLSIAWSWSLRKQVALRTRALQQNEELQRAMIACSPVALYSIDNHGLVQTWNASAERIFGWTAAEVLGAPLPVVPEGFAEEHMQLRDRVLRGEVLVGVEIVRKKKDGSLFHGSLSISPIRDPSGAIIGIMGAMLDISERKRAEARVEHLNRVLRAIRDINHLIVHERQRHALSRAVCRTLVDNRGYAYAVIILSGEREGTLQWAEAGTSESLGWLPSLLDAGHLPVWCASFESRGGAVYVGPALNPENVARNGGTAPDIACARLMHDGTVYGFLVVEPEARQGVDAEERTLIAEMASDLGYGLHVMAMNRAREMMEQQHRALQDQMIQAQKMESVGRLAGGVAHDFNNFLGVIVGYAELALLRVHPNDPLHADLLEIAKAAKRSTEVTRQLLAFARKQTISPRVLDLNEVVEGMLKMLRRLIGEEIELAWLPDPALWRVKMDTAQIDQILANLCVNARDAISGVGQVVIETHNVTLDAAGCAERSGVRPGEYVMLSVSDNGSGMDEATLGSIFEPFFTTKDVHQGTGLGLATVYGIVQQNNGFIDVDSEVGKGTTFAVYIPRHVGEITAPIVETPEIPRSRGEAVLLVEDEPSIMHMGRAMLERLGYRVVAVGSPHEALRHARANAGAIDLLITDVVMPGMNGRELADTLREHDGKLKLLYMSGYTADVIAERGVLEEGVEFIPKPFTMTELAVKVRSVLDRT